jgi:hypothetical protein
MPQYRPWSLNKQCLPSETSCRFVPLFDPHDPPIKYVARERLPTPFPSIFSFSFCIILWHIHQLCSSSSDGAISVAWESIESRRLLVSTTSSTSSWTGAGAGASTTGDTGLCTRTTRGDSRGSGRCWSSERGTVVWPVRTLYLASDRRRRSVSALCFVMLANDSYTRVTETYLSYLLAW